MKESIAIIFSLYKVCNKRTEVQHVDGVDFENIQTRGLLGKYIGR